MKITALRSSTNAVGQYRVAHPMLALRALGHDTAVITLSHDPVRVGDGDVAGDILVLARQTGTDVFGLVDALPPSRRPRLVYELDDNPWEWHSWDAVHRTLGADYARRVSAVMSRCEAVTCSTRTLAARVRREFPTLPVWVCPNSIDYQLRDWTAREDRAAHELADRIVLGWTGSIHHERDLAVMLQAVPEILADYPETVLLLQCDPAQYGRQVQPLQRAGLAAQIRWASPVAFDTHPGVYSLFDINLAPLERTPFNICKSDLRLIEGGAQGVPYVASNVAPYTEFHTQSGGLGGYLAGSTAEWVESIEKLIDGERQARGQSLARYVRETRSLSVVAGTWQAAYQAILASDPGEAVAPAGPAGRNDPCPCGSGKKYKRCHVGVYA